MKLRSFVVALALGALGTAVANCGSEDGSTFTNGGLEDGGGNTSSSGGFVDPNANDGGGNITPTGCQKLTCADLKINCGPAGDGCGGLIESCGTCQGVETCGGGGVPSVCGGSAGCVPKTCQQLGVECGPTGDGCGGQLDCGVCQAPNICGGGGPSKCGRGQINDAGTPVLPDGGACVARTTIRNAGEFNGFLKPHERLLRPTMSFESGSIRLPAGYRPELDPAALQRLTTEALAFGTTTRERERTHHGA